MYVRWQTGGEQKEAGTAQSKTPAPPKNSETKTSEQTNTTPPD
jgi:hypothetical protein